MAVSSGTAPTEENHHRATTDEVGHEAKQRLRNHPAELLSGGRADLNIARVGQQRATRVITVGKIETQSIDESNLFLRAYGRACAPTSDTLDGNTC
jgi:hypothetical protein